MEDSCPRPPDSRGRGASELIRIPAESSVVQHSGHGLGRRRVDTHFWDVSSPLRVQLGKETPSESPLGLWSGDGSQMPGRRSTGDTV